MRDNATSSPFRPTTRIGRAFRFVCGRRRGDGPVVSLRLALSLLVLVALLPALAFIALQARQVTAERLDNLEHDARELADRVEGLAERLFAERIGMIKALATAPTLRSGDLAAFHAQAKQALDPATEGILVVVDRSLQLRMSTAVPWGTPMPPPLDAATTERAFVTGEMQIADVFRSPFTGKPVVSLVLPVEGTDLVLRLTLWPTWLSDQLRKATPPGWITALTDRNGVLVARSHDPDRWVGRPGTAAGREAMSQATSGWDRFTTLEGFAVYASWRRLPSGWTAVAAVDEKNIAAVARTQTRHVTLGVAIVTGGALFFALLAAFGIGRPLARLAAAAAAVGRGDVPAPRPSRLHEINAVGTALRESALARHAAETALRQKEALLQSATDNAAVGLVLLDRDRRYTFANPAYPQILGLPYSAEELVGRGPAEMLASVYPTHIGPHLDRAFAGERVGYELSRPRPGGAPGEMAYYDVVYDPKRDETGAIDGIIVTIFDISARKATEQALLRSEERLHLAQDAARAGSWEWRLADGRNHWSEPLWTLYGLAVGQDAPSYEVWARSIHPDDRPRVTADIGAAAAAGREFEVQWRVALPEGAPDRWLLSRGKPAFAADGTVERYIGIVIDVTDRVRAEQGLRESERRLAAILEALPIGVALLDRDGEPVVGNAFYKRFALSVVPTREDPRRGLWEGFDDRGRPLPRESWPAARALRGEPAWPGHEFFFRGDAIQGPIWVRIAALPFLDAGGHFAGVIHMLVDIDQEKRAQEERRTLQAELLHVSRLSEMGQMAAALAHELNQPLTAVAVYIGAAQRVLAADDLDAARKAKLGELMRSISAQALRAGEIIRQLRDFVHKGAGERRVENVADVMREASILAVTAAKHRGVVLRTDVDRPGRVFVSKVQVQQVVFNLVRNAIEAMEASERRELTIALAIGEGMAVLAVADTGVGLAPEIVDRLFLPFSSTKSGGMGIGLSVCRNIVEAHQGRIWAEPNPGGGTVFRFALPLAGAEEEGEEEGNS